MLNSYFSEDLISMKKNKNYSKKFSFPPRFFIILLYREIVNIRSKIKNVVFVVETYG